MTPSLEVEGQGLVRGDVELHVRQKDWHSHGHSQDPNYNGVVLHAALEVDSPSTGLQSGRDTPVVSLAGLLAQSQRRSEEEPGGGFAVGMGLWELLGRRGFSRPRTAAEAGDLLDSAGNQRFYFKSRRFQLFLADQVTLEPGNTGDTGGGPDQTALDQTLLDQTLYEALLDGGPGLQEQPAAVSEAGPAGALAGFGPKVARAAWPGAGGGGPGMAVGRFRAGGGAG